MIYPLTDLNSWPLRDNEEPIFQTSNDAIFYAQFIWDLPEKQKIMDGYRKRTYALLKFERQRAPQNWDRMMDLAVRAQFFRECLEECHRIRYQEHNH